PGSARSDQSSTSPERFIARVSAVVSARVMPRKNTAMAKAAICPSLIEPSRKPRRKAVISASPSSTPSRLRRMISCGMSIGSAIVLSGVWKNLVGAGLCPARGPGRARPLQLAGVLVVKILAFLGAEIGEEAGEIAGGRFGGGERAGMRQRLGCQPFGKI